MSDREGIVFLAPEYCKRLVMSCAEEAGMPVALQSDQIKRLAEVLHARGIRLVNVEGPYTNTKVEQVESGKAAAEMAYILKGAHV